MSTIVTRSGKGSPLTNTELDANFTNLNSDKLELSDLSAGSGISLSAGGAIANTAPDQTVALTGAGTTSVSGTYPNFTITGAGTTYTAGSGLSLTGTEFANTAPDQTVALTGAGATSISGTYPNFTITSANTTYSVGDGGLTQINFTSADHTKLDGIAVNANNYTLPFTNNSANWNTAYTYSQVGHLPLAGGTLSGTLTGTTALLGGSQIIASTAALQVNGFQRTGTIYLHEGNTAVAGNNWPITTTSGGELQWNGNKVWTAGNDGSGSGLDADLLDGQQGSYYYPASNPNGYTTNVGDITGVTAGTGLTGGGTSGTPTLNVIGGDGITANANDIALDNTVIRTTGAQTKSGQMNFNDLVRINDTAPILRMTAAANNLAKIEFGNSTDTDAGKLTYGTADDSLSFTTNTAERARFTSAGILLVGKTSTSVTVTGCSINPNGQIYNIVDTPAPMGFHVRNNSGTDSTAAFACYSGLTTIGSYNPYGGAHPVIINLGTTGEKLRLDAQGDLGIGVTNPLEKLHVAGNIIATGNITAYYSDERLKDFKGTIPNALDKVGQLNGYYYTPNETAQALGVDNNGVEVGVSAQEVEAVLPEIVTKSAIGDDYKTVYYEKITPLLIEAVKELTQKVEKLELRLNEMGE